MRRIFLPALILAVLMTGASCKKNEEGGQAGTTQEGQSAAAAGVISGQITLAGGHEDPVVMKVNKENEYCGDEKTIDASPTGAGGGLAYVVVEIEGLEGAVNPLEDKYRLTAEKCEFKPFIQMIPKNSSMTFKNLDDIDHIAYGIQDNQKVFTKKISKDTGSYLSIETAPMRDAGPILVKSGSGYKWMAALIYVQNSAYQAMTDTDGKFEFKDVPAGKHKVTATRYMFIPSGGERPRLELFKAVKSVEVESGAKDVKIEFSTADDERQQLY